MLIRHHGYTECFKYFKGFWQIEDGLGTCTDDGNWCLTEFGEIGGDIKALFCTTMNAADATGCEYFNAGTGGSDHGGGDRCGTGHSARHGHRQISTR